MASSRFIIKDIYQGLMFKLRLNCWVKGLCFKYTVRVYGYGSG